MKAWGLYALGSAVLLLAIATGLSLLVEPQGRSLVWLSAAIAYGVQLLAFLILVKFRGTGTAFMLSWAGGMVLRVLAVVALAVWVTRQPLLSAETALLSLVGFIFLLVLLEPVFLRWADR